MRRSPVQTVAMRAHGDPVKLFRGNEEWDAWLGREHAVSGGVWLRIAKKGSKLQSVSYKDALQTALCYGWIDGQKRPENEDSWLQRFLPRSARSFWSKLNRAYALALIANGRMRPAGLAAIASAKRSGQWQAAYDSPSRAETPGDFLAALAKSPKAAAFFETLDKTNRYAVLWRIQTVKRPETRARKIAQFVAMLERREKIHPAK